MQRHEQFRQSCITPEPCSRPHIERSPRRSKWGLFLMPYCKEVAPLFGARIQYQGYLAHKKQSPSRTL